MSALELPICLTADEAEERRAELADALRRLADEIESGRFQFVGGERLTIRREFTR